jgi:two-component system, sporulation sensor kinase A
MNLPNNENFPSDVIFNQAPFGVVILSSQGKIENANTKANKILGVTEPEKLTGQYISSFIQAEDAELFKDYLNSIEAEGYKPGWRLFNFYDAQEKPIRILFFGLPNLKKDQNNHIFYFIESNVDFRGLDRENLPTIDILGSKYWSIFEFALIGLAIFDEDLNFDEVNQSFADYFNLNRAAVQGKHYSQVFNHQSYHVIRDLLEDMKSGNQNFNKNVITLPSENNESKILELSLAKLINEVIDKKMMIMLVEDITNQRDTHKALIQSEKLALTGRLAASLAHEINNPLQTSVGCLGLAAEMLEDDDRDLRVYIQMAMEELQRSARIVKKLRDLNHITDESEKTLVDLHEILGGVLVLTQKRLYDRNIVPVFPFEGKRPIIMASSDQIQQVFLNLIMNAIDALPNGGNIYLDIIETTNPIGEKVIIRDTGMGIPEENMSRLFDPFYTTKDDGLGLGLFICKNIIENHNGTLSVESQPGVGTAFSIWLPGLD